MCSFLKSWQIKEFKEGNSYDSYNFLGCREFRFDDKEGFLFTVWAPNAKEVYLVGDFNNWDRNSHLMKNNEGIWEIFIDNAKYDDLYKFRVIGKDNIERLKSDPYARFSEFRPNNASVIYKSDFVWTDNDWQNKKRDFNEPMNIYEVHFGSWKRKWTGDFFSYKELFELIDYVKDMEYTHIEIMPITEHPLDKSWGYQATGYYSVTSRYGTPDEFKSFVNECHKNNIGIILDLPYSHFCKDEHGLYRFDGTTLYEYKDPKKSENIGWGTAHFDVGKGEVISFLISNAMFWLNEYHIDGIRVDAVSSMLYLDYERSDYTPNIYGGHENIEAMNFLKKLNQVISKYTKNPLIIAEESTSWAGVTSPVYTGGLGFSYKWNMGFMNDILKYMSLDPIYRKYHHNLITFSFMYAFSEKFILSFSHDEVVHGKKSMLDKMYGDCFEKFASLRSLYSYYMIHPGKKLLFMGSEFGQGLEWRYSYSLEWELLNIEPHKKMKDFVRDLNILYKNEKSLYELDFTYNGFDFIDANNNSQSIIVLMRKGVKKEDFIISVINFTPVYYENYRIGVPYQTDYCEVLNSDSKKYFGAGYTMEGLKIKSENISYHNKRYSINIKVPPMGAVFIKGVI